MAKVTLDKNPSQASKDFTLKLTQDMIRLLQRSMQIMSMEIGARESVAVILSVLALAGASTADGVFKGRVTFSDYAKLAEQELREKQTRK